MNMNQHKRTGNSRVKRKLVYAQFREGRIIKMVNAPCWVKVGFITEKTGWNYVKLRKAREQGLVEFEKRSDGTMWYNLASLHDELIIKQKYQ
jgi:hypothetical protein